MSELSIDDFKKIELRTAQILEVHEIEGADRLWRLILNTGSETKQIVAGIKAHYPKESLVGKTIIVVNNLAPAKIRGIDSNGMLLAAKDAENFTLLTVDKNIPAGALVG